jgi:hypothetical protein
VAAALDAQRRSSHVLTLPAGSRHNVLAFA